MLLSVHRREAVERELRGLEARANEFHARGLHALARIDEAKAAKLRALLLADEESHKA